LHIWWQRDTPRYTSVQQIQTNNMTIQLNDKKTNPISIEQINDVVVVQFGEEERGFDKDGIKQLIRVLNFISQEIL